MKIKIVHITTVHQRFDSRIFYKQCVSLKQQFNNVTLIVADGKGNQVIERINIIDIGPYKSRLKRLFFAPKRAIKMARSLNADIYQIHDPELLIATRKLCNIANVIFDSHEDFPLLMLQRPYIAKPFRKIFFLIAQYIEKKTCKKLSAIITATEKIQQKFLNYGKNNVICVKNYPIINSENLILSSKNTYLPFTCCYVGGLTAIRGVKEMIIACEKADVKLILAGPVDDTKFLEDMKLLSGWKNVEYLGIVPHNELKDKVYQKSDIGLNMLLSAPNHTDAIPIKQLEYMSYGLPVVATKHIKFCVDVTNKTNCGILVTPENIEQCVEAIEFLKNNPQTLKEMSENAQQAIKTTYNWDNEANKLIKMYNDLFKNNK